MVHVNGEIDAQVALEMRDRVLVANNKRLSVCCGAATALSEALRTSGRGWLAFGMRRI
jgi:anti-anti-sigma regulatory factor